jgi:Family of unknown function (DUF6159)
MFFDRLSNGWHVAMQSWAVLRQDKQLVLFPILSGLALALVLASFALPAFLIPGLMPAIRHLFDDNAKAPNAAANVLSAVFTFVFYVVNYFVIVYFNTALASCAIYRFRGGEPTVGMGLQMANKRLPQIFAWSVVAATVGVILNAISEKSEFLGKIVAALLGGLWSLATCLVVPTLAVEGLGPIDALKRSTSLIIRVWGEGMAGDFNIGIIGFLLVVPAILVIVIAAVAKLPVAILVLLILAAVLYIGAVSVITTAVKQVFIAGLYVYATDSQVPPGFDKASMKRAFVAKGK